MKDIRTKEINSLPDYLQFIEENCTGHRNVLFRGHADSSWKLEPKLARIPLRPALRSKQAEIEMLSEFKRRASSLAPRDVTSDWDWLALAQHHGLPTRLLDWTTNALVAFWFTIENPPKLGQNGSVWIFFNESDDYANSQSLPDPFSINKTLIYRPRHASTRITAQSGWFTIHKRIEKSDRFIPLEKNKSYKERLIKLIIPGGVFRVLREDINRCGINSASIFPDLDGLTKQITWEISPPPDEAELIQMIQKENI
ncbi:FRG domain-containing protein [Chromobacterium subtsugae]|uniref:FRG domain-containing protein n=1 Tax=Chromobacterium subtsugae TaxID=251747 RepID=UPI0009B9FB88|nr:FRG domain-containing protein [Chromobacterium subtsugae]